MPPKENIWKIRREYMRNIQGRYAGIYGNI